MTHPNEEVLRGLYALFAKGDIPGFLAGCTDDVAFTVPGSAAVSGAYTKGTFLDLVAPVMELSGGTFQEEVVDVFANDEHVVGLHRVSAQRSDKSYETTEVIVFHVAGGQVTEAWEHPFNLYGQDELFSA